ncbi:hypothetical protein [Acerihabitans arboris]|uniref:UDP-N-acetylglucosamine kinase n=1 Tax=Acerihabitans arboris TaxID=2691583 RepID=A0A845SLC6_9GAMM|nr:hypothetical protein [Acerihabitans arboris]NDL63421.1 hypothetical protein [Acerihabitans arboris]
MSGSQSRPFIFVLAGVNGGGKSSVGGSLLAGHGLAWFNPDTYARELMSQLGLELAEANGRAWAAGRSRLEAALAEGASYAFETTLGGNTIPRLLAQAVRTHDVIMLFCGLSSPEQHIRRVQLRVAHGGHAIAGEKIRERWITSRANLIRLLPLLAHVQVFDNSVDAAPGDDIPDPVLVLEVTWGTMVFPAADDARALAATPEWARPLLEAAMQMAE